MNNQLCDIQFYTEHGEHLVVIGGRVICNGLSGRSVSNKQPKNDVQAQSRLPREALGPIFLPGA